MRNSNYKELNAYPESALIKTALAKLWQRKAVKLTVCGAVVLLCAYIAETIRSNQVTGRLFDDIMETVVFAVMILGAAYFTANIGAFNKRRFIEDASVVTVLLWAASSVWRVISGFDPTQMTDIWQVVFRVALYHVPTFLIAFGMVMALGTLIFRQKKQA